MAIKTKQFSIKERINFWKNHLSCWEQSQLSQSEYCRQNNLDKYLFSKWKIKLNDKAENTGFIEIPINNLAKEPSNTGIELIINDSVKIKLDENYNENLLKKVLRMMENIN